MGARGKGDFRSRWPAYWGQDRIGKGLLQVFGERDRHDGVERLSIPRFVKRAKSIIQKKRTTFWKQGSRRQGRRGE